MTVDASIGGHIEIDQSDDVRRFTSLKEVRATLAARYPGASIVRLPDAEDRVILQLRWTSGKVRNVYVRPCEGSKVYLAAMP